MAGDPFLYASGPEEAQACAKAGLGFEIVPGVSSVDAVPAYAGIPLTTKDHREVDRRQLPARRSTGAATPTTGTLVLLSAVGTHRRDRQGADRRRPLAARRRSR